MSKGLPVPDNPFKAQLSYNLSGKTSPPGNFRKNKGKYCSVISKCYHMNQGLE